MIVQRVQCDRCGTLKDQTNNWFSVTNGSDGTPEKNSTLVFFYGARPLNEHRHLCGQECCQKELQEWMDAPAKKVERFVESVQMNARH